MLPKVRKVGSNGMKQKIVTLLQIQSFNGVKTPYWALIINPSPSPKKKVKIVDTELFLRK